MAGRIPLAHGRCTPPRRTAAGQGFQPRVRRLFAAAILARGDLKDLAGALGLSSRSLGHLLCLVRSQGAGRAADLFDPRRCGRPCEVQARVQLASYTRASITSFETWLQDDPAVTCAVQVTGRDDYQIVAFHKDHLAANLWARELCQRPEVARVTLSGVRTLFGHHLAGVPLGARLERDDDRT